MYPAPTLCPVCQQTLAVTRLHCQACDTAIEGRFQLGGFGQLTPEQLAFAAAFIKNEGKLNRLERELDLSYPTLRARLTELIRAMGFEPGQEEAASAGAAEADRLRVLDELAAGKLSADEAIKALKGNG
jgi:hypothetical protein